MATGTDKVGAPAKALWAREALALPGLGAYLAAMPCWWMAPAGDGHPVLVLPGLLQSDLSTLPLRQFLGSRGYTVCPSDLKRNTGRSSLVDEFLLPRLQALHEQHGQKISIVGWSMGGLFARDLARRAPGAVRQVVTLGSPFTGPAKASNVWRLYEVLSGERAGDPRVAERFQAPHKVPVSSIYSRRDGIVAWQCCVNEPGPCVENIEVISSHCGMGHHPAVLYAIADRLAQAQGQWRPFAPTGLARRMYPAPASGDAATASAVAARA